MTLPASEETVPATDADLKLMEDTAMQSPSWANGAILALIARIRTEARPVTDTVTEGEIDMLRIKAFKSNSDADRQAYFDATSKWFQDRHYRAIAAAETLSTTREQAVRECAEIARSIATDLRNGDEARFQAGVLASRLLSLIDRSAK